MFSSQNSQVSNDANYIEDVFSTYLYTGNGSTQTITNGIDLSTKGGLLWLKARSTSGEHALFDTTRGTGTILNTDSTNQARSETGLASFNTDGFSFANAGSTVAINFNGRTFASGTFRKQPKFFDVVTYTGNGVNRTIAHNLGSVPGFIIVKCTSTTSNWPTYHRSLSAGNNLTYLNLTNASTTSSNAWNNTAPTATEFSVGGTSSLTNSNGETYVAYLFAHNAGGFGLTGTDNVISCGSYVGDGSASGQTITLGYEPQWIMVKSSTTATNWQIYDNMRGWSQSVDDSALKANSSAAEDVGSNGGNPIATGFLTSTNSNTNTSGETYIYIAIRRGPMKVPTDATKVFAPVAYTGNSGTQTATTGFPVDAMIEFERTNSSGVPSAGEKYMTDRLRGSSAYLETSSTNLESTGFVFGLANNTGVTLSTDFNTSPKTYIIEAFGRAPGFFDEVCYTGTGSARTVTHNLGVAPELMLVKRRDAGASWVVYSSGIAVTDILTLQSTNAAGANTAVFNATAPTSSVFSVGTSTTSNGSGGTYVAYLFATCAGVSKVGSYTGTGTTKQVNCGFTAGARFVLIKRTDSTGDWYVWDSARGIVSGNDPYLLLNSTAAEVTSTDYIDTYSAGFEISSTAPSAINANGGTYIFLAIA